VLFFHEPFVDLVFEEQNEVFQRDALDSSFVIKEKFHVFSVECKSEHVVVKLE